MFKEITPQKLDELQESALYLLRKQWEQWERPKKEKMEETEPEMIDPNSNQAVQV